MSRIITKDKLLQLAAQRLDEGKTIAGPVEGSRRLYFAKINKPEELVLDAAIMPSNSIKEFFFPRCETICTYQHNGKEQIIKDTQPLRTEQIIIGARPCDAASLPILDKVFSWDFQDKFYQDRREKSTVISFACSAADENCFCSSVGLSPDTSSGSDVMLVQIDAEAFEVRIFTDKGEALFAGQTTEADRTGQTASPPPVRFNKDSVAEYLQAHFGDPVFNETSLRCVGCGACTYVCPTCHCFDIVDEGGADKGKRVKNWDSCQFSLFTLHASGHNPRKNQAARQYNRIAHKFNIYPQKFGAVLCTGCGNCTRVCSASLGVRPVLELLSQKSEQGKN
ncbi:MAG: 4Fe-4S dicluster domain-containing protein [Planctomycetaceae bacterium]|jgi:ferredoxin|nr:4Fe-4S dicluster domain-containing protein [Planctomycetaceae bacterium]